MPDEARQGLTLEEVGRVLSDLTADLLRVALRLSASRAEAEDLVQDTVVRAVRARHTFRGEATPRTWLHRILYNLAADRARRGDRELLVDDVEGRWRDHGYSVDPADVVARAADEAALHDALVRLPFIYRSAVVLHDSLGWTHADIAERMGISVDNAKQRVHRGRMLLTTALAEGGRRRELTKGVLMRCWDARLRVGDYLDGALDAPARAGLEAHLATCPTCPPLYAALVGATEALGARRDADSTVPPALAARVAEALADRR